MLGTATYEASIPKHVRDQIPDEDFAGPGRTYPIRNQQDVHDAATLIGHAANPEQVKANIIKIAKRKGFSLPDAWQSDTTESLTESTDQPFSPKPRVATIKVCWIEDGAVSLNGRVYPKETVDKLISSAQLALADPDHAPLTCYLSHSDAEQDATKHLVGKITDVWREGSKGMANIDIPDTNAGRDTAALAAYRYITTQSLRASGAELRIQRGGLPLVVEAPGQQLTLNGIDFTTNPGLDRTARIQQVLLESADHAGFSEAFDLLHPIVQEAVMPTKTQEAGANQLPQMASGVTSGTDGSSPGSAYASKMMPGTMPTNAQNGDPNPMAHTDENVSLHEAAHNAIAEAMQLECHTGRTSEAGAKFSGGTKGALLRAHDHCAEGAGLACKGKYSGGGSASSPQPNDMEDSMESMTPDKAAKLLEAAGYKVEAPKTQAQVLQAKLDAMEAKLDALATAKAVPPVQTQENTPPPQRKSLSEGGATTSEAPRAKGYKDGDYLRSKLTQDMLEQLAGDRSYPWPKDVNPLWFLKELSILELARLDHHYPIDL
jgi:hypothetical protein